MKAIMMSIRPEWVAKILNGEKTIEIRKKFPKDYVGWVYIYCTKGKQLVDCPQWVENELSHQLWYDKDIALLEGSQALLNGKVVARFWVDKVEEIYNKLIREITNDYSSSELPISTVAQMSCLTKEKLLDYVGDNGGYAIHITKLEIFDKPKEIKEFVPYNIKQNHYKPFPTCDFRLTRAPESWCYVEIGE